nr:ATP-binding protein [Gaetbulibacter sp. 4G1]
MMRKIISKNRYTKLVICLGLCFNVWIGYTQDITKIQTLKTLKKVIRNSEKAEKLKLLDSLTNLVKYQPEFKYDSIVKATIEHAIAIDSFNLAGWHTASFIYHQNSILEKPNEGLKLFTNFEPYLDKLTDERSIGRVYLNVADSYYFLGEIEKSISVYNIAKEHALASQNNSLIAFVHLYTSYAQDKLGLFADASQNIKEAAKRFQIAKDTFNIVSTKNLLANLYSRNSFFIEAAKERKEAVFLAKKTNDYRHLVTLYNNASIDYRKQNKHNLRLKNLEAALLENKKIDDINTQYRLLCSLTVAYLDLGNNTKATMCFNEAQELKVNDDYYSKETSYLNAKKHLLYSNGDYQKALEAGKTHLKIYQKQKKFEETVWAHQFLNKTYLELGEKEKAYEHLAVSTALKDSIVSAQNIKSLVYYQTLYETEKRDLQIEKQQTDIALLDEKNKIKNQWMLIGGLILLSIFGFISLIRSRNFAIRKQRLQADFSKNLVKAQEDEKAKIALDLHDSVGQKLMYLTREVKSKDDRELQELASQTLESLRVISRTLHPSTIEKLGFTAALEELLEEVKTHTDIIFSIKTDNVDQEINSQQALYLYRIVQELLSNVIKHSGAENAFFTVTKTAKVILIELEDDGIGFEVERVLKKGKSLGMQSIYERCSIINATCKIESHENKGTKTTIKLNPFN